jgi:hypothetical protein
MSSQPTWAHQRLKGLFVDDRSASSDVVGPRNWFGWN